MMGFVKFLLYCILVSSCSCRPNVNGQLQIHVADLLTRLTQMVDKYEETSDQIDRLVDKFEETSDQMDRIELLGFQAICQIPDKIGKTDSTVKVLEDGRMEAQFSCPGDAFLQGSKILTCDRHGWNGTFPCCHTFKLGDQVRLKHTPSIIGSIERVYTNTVHFTYGIPDGIPWWPRSKKDIELFPLICSTN